MPNDTDLQKLIDQINIYHPQADFDQISKRRDGQPYFVHPLSVAFTLARLQLDDSSIIASLLHDVVEDTRYSVKKIELNFGKEVAFLVEGVTKLKKLKYRLGRKEYFSENLKKMFVAMAKDIRVVLIKLADRLHNMETIGYVSQEERIRKAYEVMEIYAPLAQRLGIGEIRDRLEDIAFQYIYPEEHKWVKEISAEHYIEADKYLQKVKTVLQKSLREQGIEAEIDARAKHLYSLYKKLLLKDKDINKIYDLVALRVIVNTISECYETLGMIHKQWFPLLGMIKDYISLPKPNGYRSLHTTVFCLEGRITEFQIRTWQMHYEAEHGVAAHWYYADKKKSLIVDEIGLKKGFKVPGEILKWVEELPKWQKELTQGEDLLNTLRIDTLEDRIFVFTPHGDVVDLPVGATAIDFAYAIHTLVGDRCLGAKVNGKLAELSLELKNGDIVEILRSKNERKPKRDWLNFVKTTRAKTAIKKSLSL